MRILDETRMRRIGRGFSWIDRKFLRDGWLQSLSSNEQHYYFFLVLTCDRFGISFYSDEKTASLLKISVEQIQEAREILIEKELIIFKHGVHQVLPIP